MGSRSKRTGRVRKGRAVLPSGVVPQLPVAAPPAGGEAADAACDVLSSRLRKACGEALAEALGEARDVRALCEVVEQSYAALDDILDGMDFDPPVACAKGCLHCCFNQVSLTPPEAIYLGLYVMERFSAEEKAETVRRVEHLLTVIQGRSRRELGDIRHLTPCAFLRDGACSVHTARPLACRGWNSVNPESCRLSVENLDPLASIESYAVQRDLSGAVQEGLLESSAALGLEAGYLVMTRAVRLMEARGVADCARDWLEGRPFFAAKLP